MGSAFDQKLAVRCAIVLRDLYNDEVSPTINIPSTDTQAWVGKILGITYIIFPGTASAHDIFTDLRAAKTTFQPGRVHAGFFGAYRSILDSIVASVGPEQKVIISGHSLGGAIAMLTAFALQSQIAFVYTFGQPRVGNGSFARAYNALLGESTFRLVNDRDPVPRIPWMFGTYRHAGREVFLARDGRILVDRSPLLKLVQIVKDAAKPPLDDAAREFVSLDAHHITRYLEKLREIPNNPSTQ